MIGACRAKETLNLVRWLIEDMYKLLSRFGEALKIENSGIVFNFKLDDDKYFFEHFFVAWVLLFESLLVEDETCLRRKYTTSTCKFVVDGKNQIT